MLSSEDTSRAGVGAGHYSKLITAGLTFPSGVSYDPSTIEWESLILDGAYLGTITTREAESRRADLIFMRSRRRPGIMGRFSFVISMGGYRQLRGNK